MISKDESHFFYVEDGAREAIDHTRERLTASFKDAVKQLDAASARIATLEVEQREMLEQFGNGHAPVLPANTLAPASIVAWARDIVSRLPMAGDQHEPVRGVKLGDLRAWLQGVP